MNMRNATKTLIPCPVCRNSTNHKEEKLWASDDCKTAYPGMHAGRCVRCELMVGLFCIGNHEPRDFFLSRDDAIEEDQRRKEAKEQR